MIESTGSTVTYAGDGQQTVFAFPVRFFAAEDIRCYLFDGTHETEVDNFTVALAADPNDGGTVTFAEAPPSGTTLTIARELEPVQPVSLPTYGKIPSAEVERELDRLTMLLQQLREQAGRALAVPHGMDIGDFEDFYRWMLDRVASAETAAETAATAAETAETAASAADIAATSAEAAAGAVAGAVSAHNAASDAHSTLLAAKAPLDSPTLTGTPKAPTAAAGTNSTQIATTAFVKTAVSASVRLPDWSNARAVFNSTSSSGDDIETDPSPTFTGTTSADGWYVFAFNNINKLEDQTDSVTLTIGGKIVYQLSAFQHNAPYTQADSIALPLAAGTNWKIKLVGYWSSSSYASSLPARFRVFYMPFN